MAPTPPAAPKLLTSYPDPADAQVPDNAVWGLFLFVNLTIWPRTVFLAFWLFGSQIGRAFDSWVIPAVGFLIAPFTTVTYALMWAGTSHGVHGAEWIPVGVAALLDLWAFALGRRLLRLFRTGR